MKWQFVSLLFLPILMFSCRKETSGPDITGKITNPTDYVLVSQVWSGPTTNGLSMILTYNDENLVSDITYIQWWGGLQANGDTAYEHFLYSNGLCRKVIHTETTGNNGNFVYEYNQKGLPVKMVTYNLDTYYKTERYEYDSADRLIRAIDSSWRIDFIHDFTYDNQGNLASESTSSPYDSLKTRNDYKNYDDKVNYNLAINGLPTGMLFYGPSNSIIAGTKHNALSSIYSFEGIFSFTKSPIFYEYQCQYNDQGLPTQIISGPWIITNEYRKYK